MKKRQQPENLRLKTIIPVLTVEDLERSLVWYRDVVGFFVSEEIKEGESLRALVLKAGTTQIILNQDNFARGRDRVKGVGFSLYCETRQNIDHLAAAITSRGGELQTVPTDQPWGSRDFSILDPDGYKLTISSLMED